MPSYKLQYFDGKGRAEVSRYLFALAGVEYEDSRVQFADWPDVKKTTEQGQLPILTVDDERFPQSLAFCRYLAREFGFYGNNNLEATRIDVVVQTACDVLEDGTKVALEKDEAKKAELQKEFEEALPGRVEIFTRILEKNQNGVKFFVGDKISLADVAVFNLFNDLLVDAGLLKGKVSTKKLADLVERVGGIPEIAAWIKKRPETKF